MKFFSLSYIPVVSFVILIIIGCSDHRTRKQKDYTVEDNFVEIQVDKQLIELLGGVENLRSYQLYLSDTLSLIRMNRTAEVSSGHKGNVHFSDDKYRVSFTPNTPGAYKGFGTKNMTYRTMMGSSRTEEVLAFIDVWFDDSDNSFLRFYDQGTFFDLSEHQNTLGRTYSKTKCIYEGEEWEFVNNVCLMIHLDKNQYNSIYEKNAKGRFIK